MRLEMLRSLAHTLQAGFNAEDAANGKVKPENDTFEPIQELEALVKDYKETISALEQELKDARAPPCHCRGHPGEAVAPRAAGTGTEEAEKGSSHTPPLFSQCYSSHHRTLSVARSRDRERETARASSGALTDTLRDPR